MTGKRAGDITNDTVLAKICLFGEAATHQLEERLQSFQGLAAVVDRRLMLVTSREPGENFSDLLTGNAPQACLRRFVKSKSESHVSAVASRSCSPLEPLANASFRGFVGQKIGDDGGRVCAGVEYALRALDGNAGNAD